MDSLITAKTGLLQALISAPGYGLELIGRVRDRTNGTVVLNQGSVYPALRALEKDGLVRSWEADPTPERGGRPRRYYELTADGLRAARDQKDVLARLLGLAEAIA